jgi:hypothetical protein
VNHPKLTLVNKGAIIHMAGLLAITILPNGG